jgi:hypothetical protein
VVVDEGDTEIELPVPTGVPPQLPEYQCHEAPVPNEPPVTVNVLEFPEHTGFGFAEAPVGAVDEVVTVTVTVAHVVLLQVPSALT